MHCVRCGRPVLVQDFVNRTFKELPPYCNFCKKQIAEWISAKNPEWPKSWFGHAERKIANGNAIWQVDVSHFEAHPFYTPLFNGFKEGELDPNMESLKIPPKKRV